MQRSTVDLRIRQNYMRYTLFYKKKMTISKRKKESNMVFKPILTKGKIQAVEVLKIKAVK